MKTNKEIFGKTKQGEEVIKYTVEFPKLKAEFLNYGCTIKSLYTPDKNGKMENIVLGFDTFEKYEKEPPCYFGCIVGRIAGRTQNGILDIKGDLYQLTQNNGRNNLHGGKKGLHNRVWESKIEELDNKAIIVFKTFSPHLEEGFPGDLDITVKYIVDENSISIEYEGIPDRDTYLSLTNHVYFNLSGDSKKKNLNTHSFTINSKGYFAVNKEILPIKLIEKDPIFTNKIDLKKSLKSNHEQIEIVGNGYDHPFLLEKTSEIDGYVEESESGRRMEFVTDQPIAVFYTGNNLNLERDGFKKHSGFCLETQDYPDVKNIAPEKMVIYSKIKPYMQKTKFIFT